MSRPLFSGAAPPPPLIAGFRAVLGSAATLAWTPVPELTQLGCWLADESTCRGPLSADVARAVAAAPPFWSVLWPAGRVLAARIAADPSLVAGRTVVDFGAGSGLVALAAAAAGASRTIACDIDPLARVAAKANAAGNGLCLEIAATLTDLPLYVDVIFVADVLYDAANAPLLAELSQRSRHLYVADCRSKPHPTAGFKAIAEQSSSVWPDVDASDQFRRVQVYHHSKLP